MDALSSIAGPCKALFKAEPNNFAKISGLRTRLRRRLNTPRAAAAAFAFSFPYDKVGDCVLYAAADVKDKKPKALLQFLGGAFIGAAPELTYSCLVELLAKQGFLIIAAPYNVTFDHELCARRIHRSWSNSLDMIYNTGCPQLGLAAADVVDLPLISVGHSNGALMQILIASFLADEKVPKANAVISFSNRPAVEAVPFFDQLGASLSTLAQGSPLMLAAEYLTEETMKLLSEPPLPLPLPPGIDRKTLDPVKRFVQQIPSVFGQVADGISEFRPTPEQNREIISTSYSVPHNLLVKFTVDTIDETDALEDLLAPRVAQLNGSLQRLVLNGTHATPLVPDIKMPVGRVYTPADAVNQAIRRAALADVKNLAREIGSWFDNLKASNSFE